MGMGTPLGNCQAWGSAPVSYHHHFYLYRFSQFDPSGYILIQQNKVQYDLALSFCVDPYLCNRVRELYIIKISLESRAWLSCYDLEGIIVKGKNKKK